MGALFIFILISVLVISALLFFNKGEKAQEIKSTFKDILENLKELFSNLKKLFLILKDLIQAKLDNEPIKLEDESSVGNSPAPELSTEDSNPETTESKSDVMDAQKNASEIEVDTPDVDSNPETTESKSDVMDAQ